MHAAGVVEQSGVAAEAEAVEAGQDRDQQRAQACEESFHGVLLGIKRLVEHPLYPSARLSGSVGLWAQPTLSARLGLLLNVAFLACELAWDGGKCLMAGLRALAKCL